MQQQQPKWQADLALAFVAVVWGTTFVVVKQALNEISAVYFLSLRFALASLCMLLLFWPAFRRAGKKEVWLGLSGGALAGIFLWLGYMLQTFGLKYTGAGKSGFLTGLYIVLVPLLSAALFRRWPQWRELLAILAAAAGITALSLPSFAAGLQFNRGDMLTVGCAVAFAFHLLLVGYFSQRRNVQAVALGQILCAAALSAMSLFLEPPTAHWSRGVVFAIALTAVFATALAFALQTWGQKHTTPTRTALIFALEPVIALATAVAIGGEQLTLSAVIGGSLVLAGILVVELRPSPVGAKSEHATTKNSLY
jgi:drug/metabolite transporter (DMT)-like permease